MSEEQINQHRISNRYSYMTDEQLNRRKYKSIQQFWDYGNPCKFCDCIYLTSEKTRTLCCNDGKWLYESGRNKTLWNLEMRNSKSFTQWIELPEDIKSMAINNCTHFTQKSAFYNNMFSVATTGVDNGRNNSKYEQMNMVSCVKLNGRTYHYFSNDKYNSGIANFIHDERLNDAIESSHQNSNVNFIEMMKRLATKLQVWFKNNNIYGYDISRKSIQQELNATKYSIKNRLNVEINRNEVGIILNHNNKGTNTFTYRTKDNKNANIDSYSDEVESLLYPLLFPFGERGWGSNLKNRQINKIQLMKYLCCRLLQPEKNTIVVNGSNINRFQLMSRLSQYWMIQNFSRALDFHLDFQRQNQQLMLGKSVIESRDEMIDTVFVENDKEYNPNSKPTYLSASFTGQ
jgi:hypothetical protein